MSTSKAIERYPSRFVADDDDTEDVLSLCDMPLYGDADDCSFSSSSSSSEVSVSSSGDEFFEFSSTYDRDRRRPGPVTACESHDILFCGKLIPYAEETRPKMNKRGVTKKAKARGMTTYTTARCDKWYMLAFGLARFPSEMAMSEIRRRQGKGNRGAMVAGTECGGRTKGKEGGAWWMLKALGCSRREDEGGVGGGAGAVVKASFGCIQRL